MSPRNPGTVEQASRLSPRLATILCGLVLLALSAGAQQVLDRTKIPPPGKTPELRVPVWTKDHARERRGTDRVGEARPAARVVLAARAGRGRPVRDGRPARRGEHHRLDAERGNEDARRRSALQRAAVARHVGERRHRQRVGVDGVRRHHGEVRADARHPRRHADELHLPGAGPRSHPRPAAGRAQHRQGAARRDCATRVPEGPLRHRAPVRPADHRGDAQGDHAR